MRRVLALLVLLVLAIIGVRLASAPYDSVWLGDIAERYLAERTRGTALAIDAVRIDFSGTAAAPLTLLDLSARSPDGTMVADVPEVRVDTAFSRLFIGDFRIGHVTVVRPEISVDRKGGNHAVPSAAEFAKALDKMVGAATADFKTFGVDAIEVDDARLDFIDPIARTFETIDMRIGTDDSTGLLEMDASVAGRAGRWNVRFRNGRDAKDGSRWFSVSAADVTVADMLPADYPVRPGRGLGLPLFPQATFHLDRDGNLKRGEMRLGVGAGYISLHDDDAILIDEMLLALSWTPDRPQILLERSFAAFGDTRIAFHGEIRPPENDGEKWQFAIEAPQARLKPRDVAGPPLTLDRALAFGSFDPARMLFDIDTFNLRAGPISVTAAGSVEFSPEGPLAAIALSSQELTVASVKRLWPAMMVPEARAWFIEHAVSGKFEDARFIVALDPLGFDGDPATIGWTPEGLRLDLTLEDGVLKTVGDLPRLTALDATGRIRDGGFTMDVATAKTVAPEGSEVDVGKGRFSIPDLRPVEKTGELQLTLSGAASDIGRIAEKDPVNGRQRLDISPDSLSGEADVTVSVSFPIRKKEEPVAPREVVWTVAATLDDFSSSEPIAGQTIEKADLRVTANAAAATLRGRGLLNGLPVEIDLEQPLEGAEGGRNQGVVLDFDAGDLAERGIDLGGMVEGKLRLNVQTGEDGVRQVVADLTQARLRLPELGWTKGAGVPAKARFTLRERDGGQVVDNFHLTSDGVNVAGRLRIDSEGDLLEADFDTFALRKADAGRLSVTRVKSGYAVELTASRFDGRGFIAKLKRGSGDGGGEKSSMAGQTKVKARIDRLIGFNDATITSFALDLVEREGSVTKLDATGLIDGRSDFSATIAGVATSRQLNVETGDAGGLFRFVDFYEQLKGGRARLDASMPGEERMRGRLVITDLAISDDPALKKIVSSDPSLISGDSRPIARRRMMARGEMSFQKMDVSFNKVGRQLTIETAALRGPVLGGALEGGINLASQQVNLKGTFVPAYALNNLFGQIPVLGQLVGGRDGGLLGVTFRVTGDMDNPVISVNPMSAIAPGIFRKIFE